MQGDVVAGEDAGGVAEQGFRGACDLPNAAAERADNLAVGQRDLDRVFQRQIPLFQRVPVGGGDQQRRGGAVDFGQPLDDDVRLFQLRGDVDVMREIAVLAEIERLDRMAAGRDHKADDQ